MTSCFSDGWTSLLEASTGNRVYFGDVSDSDRHLHGYLSDTDVHTAGDTGGWTSLSQASQQDFSRFFNEHDRYGRHRYNQSRKVLMILNILNKHVNMDTLRVLIQDEDREGKQFGLGLLPMLSAGYYNPNQLFPLNNNIPGVHNPTLGQQRPKKTITTTTTTTTTTAQVFPYLTWTRFIKVILTNDSHKLWSGPWTGGSWIR